MLLKPQKNSAFLFRSYQVDLEIDGIERYRWLEEIVKENHAYQILPVLHMKKPLVNDPTFSKDEQKEMQNL